MDKSSNSALDAEPVAIQESLLIPDIDSKSLTGIMITEGLMDFHGDSVGKKKSWMVAEVNLMKPEVQAYLIRNISETTRIEGCWFAEKINEGNDTRWFVGRIIQSKWHTGKDLVMTVQYPGLKVGKSEDGLGGINIHPSVVVKLTTDVNPPITDTKKIKPLD